MLLTFSLNACIVPRADLLAPAHAQESLAARARGGRKRARDGRKRWYRTHRAPPDASAFVPVFAYLATLYRTHGQSLARGVRTSYVVTLVILVATVVVATRIFVRGGARIHAPDLRAYLQDNESALESPPIVGNSERPQASETLKDALRSVVEPVISDTAEPRDEERPSRSDDSSSRRAVREGEAPA